MTYPPRAGGIIVYKYIKVHKKPSYSHSLVDAYLRLIEELYPVSGFTERGNTYDEC